jgi:uncharacterized cupredoxin-like copper-binding protein
MARRRMQPSVAWLLIGGAVGLSACAGTQQGGSAAVETSAGLPASTVGVTLQEWAVVPDAASVAAGPVSFSVSNKGPEDVHEFVILRTDLDPGALPTDATGAVTEDAEGMEVVEEIEDVAVGATEEVTATLTAGKYVLLCNVYSAEEQEAHYQLGMRIPFTVTE